MKKRKDASGRGGKGAPVGAFDLAGAVAYAKGSVVSRALVQKKAGTLTLFAFDEGEGLSEHSAPFD
ncbi:MAG: cupin domain-containing protein, partial [Planctomycetota bacterium]